MTCKDKDIILFVNAMRPATLSALKRYAEHTGRTFTPVILVDSKIRSSITERNGQDYADTDLLVVSADFDSLVSIRAALNPYMDRIFAVTSQYENSITELRKLVPYLPYISMPTENSLEWATEKKMMRQMLEAYDPMLVPQYMEVCDASEATVQRIEQTISFPLVVKPSGLEGSLLVSMVNNGQELRDTLKHTFGEIQKAYDKWIKRQAPAVLVEAFMEGDMYSVDTYVSADGTCRHTPPVKVVTGRKAGFDDFFGYIQLAPAGLSPNEVTAAYDATEKACHALGLRSVTAHVELMQTREGWKIVELGPRIGGFRHEIYSMAYGINHIVNDFLNRGGETPEIPTSVLSHTAFLNIYAREEGILTSLSGVGLVKSLSSLVSLKQCTRVGKEVLFAKNNGDPVFQIVLSNKSRQGLQSDIRTIEQTLYLHVETLDRYVPQKTRRMSQKPYKPSTRTRQPQ